MGDTKHIQDAVSDPLEKLNSTMEDYLATTSINAPKCKDALVWDGGNLIAMKLCFENESDFLKMRPRSNQLKTFTSTLEEIRRFQETTPEVYLDYRYFFKYPIFYTGKEDLHQHLDEVKSHISMVNDQHKLHVWAAKYAQCDCNQQIKHLQRQECRVLSEFSQIGTQFNY